MTGIALRERPRLAAVIAAVLLPPLGVWLSEGLTGRFWLSTLLTLLAFAPGMIFALWAVLTPARAALR